RLREPLRVPRRLMFDHRDQLVKTQLRLGRRDRELVLEFQRADPAGDRDDVGPGDEPGHQALTVYVVAVQRDDPGAADDRRRVPGELPAKDDVEFVIYLEQRGLLFFLRRVEHVQSRDLAIQDVANTRIGHRGLERT